MAPENQGSGNAAGSETSNTEVSSATPSSDGAMAQNAAADGSSQNPDADFVAKASDGNPKTVHGIFSNIYTAFHAAGSVVRTHDALVEESKSLDEDVYLSPIREEIEALKKALDNIPQVDLDALVKNITTVYTSLENMHVIGLSFAADTASNMIMSATTMQFGDRHVGMSAPFDYERAMGVLRQLQDAMAVLKPPTIVPAIIIN